MRLVGALLFVSLAGGIALAEDAKPAETQSEAAKPKFPLRVVRMLPETHQALLFDRIHGTHILADIGGSVGGYVVASIDDDEVTLASGGTEIVLTAPEPAWKHRKDRRAEQLSRPARQQTSEQPRPEDPYGEPVIRSVEAPHVLEAGDDGVRVAEAPTGDFVPVPAPAPVGVRVAEAPTGDPVSVPVPVSAPVPVGVPVATTDDTIIIPRADLTASISDFGKLAASIRASFTPAGVRIDGLSEASIFAKAGLRTNDLLTAVDGHALHSLEDAADLYARAQTTRNVALQITRAGKPLTLRVSIR